MDFTFSDPVLELRDRVRAFVDERVIPVELGVEHAFDAEVGPGRPYPEVMERLRAEARGEGLWNLFLPDAEYGWLASWRSCCMMFSYSASTIDCGTGK